MSSDVLLRECIRLTIESSVSTRREFQSSVTGFRAAEDLPHGFEGSRLVNDSGLPIVFYHGTRSEFTGFNRELLNTAGTAIPTNYLGFYFTTAPEVAQVYASKRFDPSQGPAKGGRVESFLLNVKKPYYITEKTYWKWGRGSRAEMTDMVERLKSQGYDGIVMPSVWRGRGRGAYDVVVFDPEQIHNLRSQ